MMVRDRDDPMSAPPTPEQLEAHPLRGLPIDARLRLIGAAARRSAAERRTKRALFFTSASLLVGFTVARWWGVAVCGFFGGSLYVVVLVVRMQRHLRAGAEAYRAAGGRPG